MKRTILTLAATAMAVAVLCTAAEAKPGNNNGRSFNFKPNHKPLVIQKSTLTNKQLVHTPKVFNHIKSNHFRTVDKLIVNKGHIKTYSPKIIVKDYHLKCGTKHSCGWCYKGFTHGHWGHSCFLPTCGCECYYDSCTLVYYYWCVPDGCWYPITYCPYGCYTF